MTAGKFLLAIAQGATLAGLYWIVSNVSDLRRDVAVLQAQRCKCGEHQTAQTHENLENKETRVSRQ